jgi:hypothetical protein
MRTESAALVATSRSRSPVARGVAFSSRPFTNPFICVNLRSSGVGILVFIRVVSRSLFWRFLRLFWFVAAIREARSLSEASEQWIFRASEFRGCSLKIDPAVL